MRLLHRRSLFMLGLLVLALALAACGGGNGGGSTDPKTYMVSGTIVDDDGDPIEKVKLTFSGTSNTAETNRDGKWTRDGLKGDVTVTPVHDEYTFEPADQDVSKDAKDVDFEGTVLPPDPYTVSGTVTDTHNEPVAGVAIRFSDVDETVSTDDDGRWTSPALQGRVTVTPEHDDYEFDPTDYVATEAESDIDFIAKQKPFPASGTILDGEDGEPIPGVVIRLKSDELNEETITNDDGEWEFSGLFGDVTVTAVDPAYAFPNAKTVSEEADDVDFEGELQQCSAGAVDDPGDACELTRIKQVQMIGESTDNLEGFYALGDDIDASATEQWNDGRGFKPIGEFTDEFRGILEGHHYEITGLYIDRPDEGDVGLFAYVGDSGEVRNLGLVGGSIEGKEYVGSVAGTNNGRIEASHNTGDVVGHHTVGGLVGDNHFGTIADKSYNTGNVTASEDYVGGIAGRNPNGTIKGAYNTGDIHAGDDSAGGVVGENRSIVKNSYNTGTVTAGDEWAGGVVGNNTTSGEVENSYNTGSVSGNRHVGGVTGRNWSSQVINSYNTGPVDGDERVGGISGANESGSEIDNSYNIGEAKGNSKAGGVTGLNDGSTVQASFFRKDKAYNNEIPGAEAKSEADMKQRSTYEDAGWDTDIWTIIDGDYPDLKSNRR